MRRLMNYMFVLLAVLALGAAVRADVRTEEKSQLKFEGTLGGMLNLFGGKAMREGTVNTVAVKGARKMTVNGETGQIIDLAEEKIYDLNMKDKSYRVTTFADLIRQMQEARKKAAEQAPPAPAPTPKPAEAAKEPQYEVDFDLKESGQRRTVNGFDAREVVMTVTVREKGKTLEENGGFVTTSNIWLAEKIPGMQEVAEFDRKYAEKLLGPALLDPQQMATVAGMYPMIGPAMERMDREKVNMNGTAVLTTTRFEAVADAATAKSQSQTTESQKKPEPAPTSLGGLGGRLARRVLDGNNKDKPAETAAPSQPGRATVMTFNQEILKVTQTVADADVAVPAGFKEKR